MEGSQAEGDFDRVFNSSKHALIGQAYLLTGDLQDAQDLVQEAFLRAWRQWGRVSNLDDPQAWIRRVLYNLAISHLRRRNTRIGLRSFTVQRPVPAVDANHLDILAVLSTLPPNQRQAIVLWSVAGLSIGEIAAELRTGEGTVRVWLSRARTTIAAR